MQGQKIFARTPALLAQVRLSEGFVTTASPSASCAHLQLTLQQYTVFRNYSVPLSTPPDTFVTYYLSQQTYSSDSTPAQQSEQLPNRHHLNSANHTLGAYDSYPEAYGSFSFKSVDSTAEVSAFTKRSSALQTPLHGPTFSTASRRLQQPLYYRVIE